MRSAWKEFWRFFTSLFTAAGNLAETAEIESERLLKESQARLREELGVIEHVPEST